VGGGGVEVAADPAPSREGGQGMPVPGYGLVALGGLGAALADIVRSRSRLRVMRVLRSIWAGCG
jgi:hypothetical protein